MQLLNIWLNNNVKYSIGIRLYLMENTRVGLDQKNNNVKSLF